MQALVLTAGLGTRLRPHTESIAKPALPFLNVPMLGYSLFLLEAAGLKHVVFNTHHAADSIRASAERLAKTSYKVSFSHEPEILGGGGGLEKAGALLDKSQALFLMNGDVVCLSNDIQMLNRMTEFHNQHDALATLLCLPNDEVGKSLGGVFVEKTKPEAGFEWGEIKAFSKNLISGLEGFHFASVILLSPKIFEHLPAGPSNILYEVLAKAIGQGEKVLAYVDRGLQWFETGDPKSYLESTRVCLNVLNQNNSQSRYLEAILKRFTPGWDNYKREMIFSNQPIPDGTQVSVATQGLVGRGVQFAPGCQLKDFLVIGEGCKLGEGSLIECSTMLPHQALVKDEKLFSSLR